MNAIVQYFEHSWALPFLGIGMKTALFQNYLPEWPFSKSLQTVYAGEGIEKKEPSYSVDGNLNGYNHYE